MQDVLFISLFSLLGLINRVQGLDNGLGLVPPMGISTWYDTGCWNLSESYLLHVADSLRKTNLSGLGYRYVNVDDCWQIGRDENGVLIADPQIFPRGIKFISDEIHKRELKFGLYTDRGTHTCQYRPGSLNHEEIDAQTFAKWEVDYLKEDSCFATSVFHSIAFEEYGKMRDALNRTGRPVFFSLCGWNRWYAPTGKKLGNSWRISFDNVGWKAVYVAARTMESLNAYSGPGGWNDPDFILGTNPSSPSYVTKRQSRTQFSLWCIMAAPLILSGSNMLIPGTFDYETISNPVAIAVNQDALGIPGRVIATTCKKMILPSYISHYFDPPSDCTQIWFKGPLKRRKNTVALVFVNWDPKKPAVVNCNAACMRKAGIPQKSSILSIIDVWDLSGSADALSSKEKTFKFSPVDEEDPLQGPGKISTILKDNGGSTFLIVEWGEQVVEEESVAFA